MKKIIGILGVAVFAVTMFLNTDLTNESKTDLNLVSLLTLNTAEAEDPGASCSTYCYPSVIYDCIVYGGDWQLTCYNMRPI